MDKIITLCPVCLSHTAGICLHLFLYSDFFLSRIALYFVWLIWLICWFWRSSCAGTKLYSAPRAGIDRAWLLGQCQALLGHLVCPYAVTTTGTLSLRLRQMQGWFFSSTWANNWQLIWCLWSFCNTCKLANKPSLLFISVDVLFNFPYLFQVLFINIRSMFVITETSMSHAVMNNAVRISRSRDDSPSIHTNTHAVFKKRQRLLEVLLYSFSTHFLFVFTDRQTGGFLSPSEIASREHAPGVQPQLFSGMPFQIEWLRLIREWRRCRKR